MQIDTVTEKVKSWIKIGYICFYALDSKSAKIVIFQHEFQHKNKWQLKSI